MLAFHANSSVKRIKPAGVVLRTWNPNTLGCRQKEFSEFEASLAYVGPRKQNAGHGGMGIVALGRRRQEDREFRASLGFIKSSRPTWLHSETLLQPTNHPNRKWTMG